MGIPCYFSHLVRNYKGVLKRIEDVGTIVDNLYLDSNSIVYDCVRDLDQETDDRIFQRRLINAVCGKLQEYIDAIDPKTVLVAF